MADKTVALVAFHNVKALGVRQLEAALKRAGWQVRTVFFKGFNSHRPKPATEAELKLLREAIAAVNPAFIALSVMSSMYNDTVQATIDALRGVAPLAAGGAFASMFPERLLKMGCDFVMKLDGELNIVTLAETVFAGGNLADVPSLCRFEDGRYAENAPGGFLADIDGYGLPAVRCADAVYIENDAAIFSDPQLGSMSYEIVASRGCPFTCSYCCCNELARLYPQGVKRVRTRSVKSVIDELVLAKRELKRLVMVHFYDEIFPNLPGWVDEFVTEYKKRIGLPFVIWGHPKMVDGQVLKKLRGAGLCEIIMGIQSGSPSVRTDVFKRRETNDEILASVETIRKSGVFWASYDFMLQHPFESTQQLRETFELVRKFRGSYELQLHGLNFLPGTAIVETAIERGLFTREQMDEILWADMDTQFEAYWKLEAPRDSQTWYELIYCLQFPAMRRRAEALADAPQLNHQAADKLYAKAQKATKLRYLYKKARIVVKRLIKI